MDLDPPLRPYRKTEGHKSLQNQAETLAFVATKTEDGAAFFPCPLRTEKAERDREGRKT